MRIAFLELDLDNRMATGERSRALSSFLRERGHSVDLLAPSPARLRDFHRFRFSLYNRLKRRTLRRQFLPHFWDYIAEDLIPRLEAGRYDVVIGRPQPAAYTLTRCGARVLKIFDAANIGFLESYHGWNADLSEVEVEYAKEMEIYRAADYVFVHHPIFADFLKRTVFDSPKVSSVRMGCYPVSGCARYSASPRLVYAGSYHYIQDPYLLSILTRQSPYPIDCYGQTNPNFRFLPSPLRYCGFREDTNFLFEYQCGVITVSQDRLRRHSPSTKFAYYFAHGLPVLFPEWMEEGHTYQAAVPYSETTFADQARRVCGERATWSRLSDAARATAAELTWDRILQPVDDLIGDWSRNRRTVVADRS